MIWNRIFIKLGATILLLFLLVLLPLGLVLDRAFSEFYYQEVQTEIEELSAHYASAIEQSTGPQMLNMTEMMAVFSKVKLYIVNARGEVVVNSGVPGLRKGSSIPRQELQTLSQGNTVEKNWIESSGNPRYLVSGHPIFSDNELYGAVFVASSIEAIDQSLEKVRSMLLLAGIGSIFLAMGMTYVLSKRLSAPLIQMEKATRKIAKGDLLARVTPVSKDELGSLACAINDLAVDLQKYRDSRSEFFSNISHELRTPMTSLEGYSKVLKDRLYETEEEKERYLDIMHQESIRLTRMIEELFDLSKMEEGKVDFKFEWVDLSEVMDSAIQQTKWKAKEKGLKIQTQIQQELPDIYCDGHRMVQIFTNLLDNAVRYTMQGTVWIKVTAESTVVKIIIEDTGPGIPKKELAYIFDRFYRVEKSRSREFGGTGLGLAIVKHLVELQNGSIQVFSNVGEGTQFKITFPVLDAVKKEEKE